MIFINFLSFHILKYAHFQQEQQKGQQVYFLDRLHAQAVKNLNMYYLAVVIK